MKDTIYRQDAIDLCDWYDNPSMHDDLEKLPTAQPETSIMTVTVKPDELVGFAEWVLNEIWDEELWEYNWQAFPELVCRKLLKLGFVTTNEEGNYERNE